MKIYEWLNKEKARFYTITIQKQDEFNILLDYKWGSCITNRKGKKNLLVKTEEEVQKYINHMLKRRKSRGYELIAHA